MMFFFLKLLKQEKVHVVNNWIWLQRLSYWRLDGLDLELLPFFALRRRWLIFVFKIVFILEFNKDQFRLWNKNVSNVCLFSHKTDCQSWNTVVCDLSAICVLWMTQSFAISFKLMALGARGFSGYTRNAVNKTSFRAWSREGGLIQKSLIDTLLAHRLCIIYV